jgi:RHS repeat-associated protein
MSQATFQGYAAVVIGDPSTGGSCPTSWQPTTAALGANWEGWVTGNVAVLGTAPAAAGSAAANALITGTARYAAAQPGSTVTQTGLYLSLDCGYATAAQGTAVPVLNAVESIGTTGGVTVNGNLACGDSGTVNNWEAAAAGTLGGLSSGSLAAGAPNWPSTACPLREAFDSWPAMFTPLTYDAASGAARNFTASNGTAGQPYILLGAPVSAATRALAPSIGGVVPAGTTAGGTTNPAAPGVAQASAGDPVNTENGHFTHSSVDANIPTYGPALSFSRTYDSGVAQQQTQAGLPGAMGYGWTDNWASSLSTGVPVPGDIYSVGGKDTYNGNGWAPTSQTLWSPGAVAQSSGDTYIADTAENRVEEIAGSTKTQWGVSMTAGHMYTVAGDQHGTSGQSGNGTAAASTLLNQPQGVVANASGLYIADTFNCRVVEIAAATGAQWGISMTAGDMYTIAGRGTSNCGTGGDNTAATASNLYVPSGLALGVGSHAGDLYIADTGNNRVQEVPITSGTEWGQSMTANDVYTVAGSPSGASGTSASGGSQASSLLEGPVGVMIGGGNNLYVADTGNCRVSEAPWGSGTQWGISMTAGNLYTVAGRNGPANCGIGDDAKSSVQSDLNQPSAVWAGNGNLYIADAANNRVQEVAGSAHTEFGTAMTAGFVYTVAGRWNATPGFAGDGGAGSSALMDYPDGAWVDGSGNLWVSDSANNRLREVSGSTNDISTVAGNGGTRLTWGNGGPGVWAGLSGASDVATDSHGDLFIADSDNNRVQEIAAATHTQFGISMTAGDVYTVAGSAIGNTGASGDGGNATSALLFSPEGVAADSAGNVYIADTGNNRVQKVSASTGNISTIAGSASGTAGTSGDGGAAASALLSGPISVAVDGNGNVYIADYDNSRVQEIAGATGVQRGVSMTAGDIYTVTGSPAGTAGYSGDGAVATAALLSTPAGVAVDAGGNLYIADQGNDVIREVAYAAHTQWARAMAAGNIYTVAGNSGIGGAATGDGGLATSAALSMPDSVATDPAGDLFIADTQNGRIQEVPAGNGTQWSQSMTAGHIYTVAGSAAGLPGESGDGGPATSALMDQPAGMAIDNLGNLFTADSSFVREMVSSAGAPFKVFPSAISGLGISISQAGGSQVNFYPKTGSPPACTAPYVAIASSSYCTLPQNVTAALTTASGSYTYTPSPGTTFTYDAVTGSLTSETDTDGGTLTVTASSPAPGGTVPGNGTCPAAAASCQTITAASGRALILGYSGPSDTGQVTSVSDPLNRTWTYGYTGSDLTSVTDPMGNKTTYGYGMGSTGDPLQANDLLTVTGPNAQPGGPNAGASTVNVYNSAGQVTSQTDPMGEVTTFSYCVNAAAGDCMSSATGSGDVTVTAADGGVSVDNYTQGVLTAQTVWNGSTPSEHDYGPALTAAGNAAGTLLDTWEADAGGARTGISYDSAGNVTSSTDPLSNTTTTASTSLGETSCTADATAASPCSPGQAGPAPVPPGGVITPPSSAPPAGVSYTLYDTNGNALYETTGIYPPGGNTASSVQTSYTLFRGNSVSLNGTNITCSATPPSPSLPCAQVDPAGSITQLAYDSAGDLISESAPDGNGSELATVTHAYNGDGQQTSVTSPDGNLPGANAGNYTTVTAYNADGKVVSVTQAGGPGATVTPRTISYGYDANGNSTTVTDPRNHATTTAYDADDEKVMVTDPDGNAALTCYDNAGRIAQTVPPAGVASAGLTAASCPANYPAAYGIQLAPDATAHTYNALGQETSVTTPAPAGQAGPQTATTTYTATGLPATVTYPAPSNSPGAPGEVVSYTYDANGQLATQTTGAGSSTPSTVSYCYDPNGRQTSVVPADGNVTGTAACETSSPWVVSAAAYPMQAAFQTTSSYDSAGQLVSSMAPATTAAPSGATTSLTYDAAGNTLTDTSPDGITASWTYNTADLPTGVSYSGSSAHAVSYAYDAEGRRTSMTDATGTSSYAFDPFGELTSVTNGAGATTGFGYNADGATASVAYPLPATATWAASPTVSYGYDNADRMTSVTDFNGNKITIGNTADGLPSSQALGSTGDTVTTAYDQTGVPSAITVTNGTSTLLGFSYADAPSGAILTETDTPSSAQTPGAYTYDQLGRVTSMTPGTGATRTYGYSASGNLTTTPTGAAGTYDAAGELTSTALGGTTTSYAYDASGQRLTAKQGSATISAGAWDGAGRLTSYSDPAGAMTAAAYDGNGVRASATTGGTTQAFTWDGAQLLMDSANAYVYGAGTTPAEQVNLATGQVSYLADDALGSVRGIIAGTGAVSATTSYDAWGNPQTAGGLTGYTPFGYAGGYTDPTGLIYLLNRYYDPATGQFVSVDPAAAQTGQPYAYANGNPVSLADPSGLWAAEIFTGVPYNSEFQFQVWVGLILGVPARTYGWEFATQWQPGTPKNVTEFGNRRIDIYNFNWWNEVKTGPTGLTGGKTGTRGEAIRDSYIFKTRGNAVCTYAGQYCQSIRVSGAIWWFSAKGITGCQTPIVVKGVYKYPQMCAKYGLRTFLRQENLNRIYVLLEPERFRENGKSFYNTKAKRAAVRAALLQNNCQDVRTSLNVLGQGPEVQIPGWKYWGVQC